MSDQGFLERLLDGAGVEWVPIGAVVEPTRNIKWNDTNKSYQYIDLTSVDICTRKITDTKEVDAETAPSRAQKLVETDDLIFATTRPAQLRYSLIGPEHSGQVASTGYCVLRAEKNRVLPKWLMHWLGTTEFKSYIEERQSGAAYPAISDAKVKAFRIPIPCPENPEKSLAIQGEIVRILDAFTELTARKKQYNHYRDQLLSFEDGEVEWKPLEKVAQYSKIRISHDQLDETNYVGVDNLLQNRAGKEKSSHVPTSGNLTEYHEGDILIGNIRPYLKKIWHSDRVGGTNGDVLVVHITDEKVNSRYLYQVLADDKFFEYNMQHAKGAKMPRGNKQKIMEYSVPIPNPEEQARIVAILDKFDTLTTSLSEGLPREIALRGQQYAYYRDLLLNFPKPESPLK